MKRVDRNYEPVAGMEVHDGCNFINQIEYTHSTYMGQNFITYDLNLFISMK